MIDPHDIPTPPSSAPGGRGLRTFAARLSGTTKSRQRRAESHDAQHAASSKRAELLSVAVSRRQPRLRWPGAEQSPPSDFAPALTNAQLRQSRIPQRGDPWDVVSAFALSYDGNAYWDGLGALAHHTMQHWTRDHVLPRGLHELRGSLFHEQRRWHHHGSEPRGRSAEYVWALIEATAALVTADGDGTGPATVGTGA